MKPCALREEQPHVRSIDLQDNPNVGEQLQVVNSRMLSEMHSPATAVGTENGDNMLRRKDVAQLLPARPTLAIDTVVQPCEHANELGVNPLLSQVTEG